MYSNMVVGKAGDTSQTRPADTSAMPAAVLQTLQSGKSYTDGTTKYARTEGGTYIVYKELHADGIIATAKTAVDISINLIGIMALFMGFMSIAEKAGGIRLYRKLLALFSPNYFRNCRRIIRPWGTW